MSAPHDSPLAAIPRAVACLGLVVHPSRDITMPLRAIEDWASDRGVAVLQIPSAGQPRRVAQEVTAGECEIVVAIGGDGTTLAAIRAAAAANRPVLGVACGSLGVLTIIQPGQVRGALERFASGDWVPYSLPALAVRSECGDDRLAFNDVSVVRNGEGQLRTTARVDGILFARFAGDGCIVSTPVGSSAYTLAAGGPLVTPGVDAFVLTTLPTHGGFCPPLVVNSGSRLQLELTWGYGGARLELDGQVAGSPTGSLAISLRPQQATLVGFQDQEPILTGLRRRGIITDSPRILARGTGS